MSTAALFQALKTQVGNPYQKLILVTLADIANEKGECWPSHRYISDRAECSRSTVIRHLKALEVAGLIAIRGRAGDNGLRSSSVYTVLNRPLVSTDVQPNPVNSHVSERHKGCVTVTHKPPIDTQDILINQIAWSDWVNYRKERNKPLTPATIKLQHEFLKTYNHEEQTRVINQSILNGWSGLFAIKGAVETKTRKTSLQDDLTDTSWAN